MVLPPVNQDGYVRAKWEFKEHTHLTYMPTERGRVGRKGGGGVETYTLID